MDETDTPTTSRGTPVSRQRSATRNIGRSSVSAVLPRRPRSTRTRSFAAADTEEPQWGYAAAVAASVKQAEDYKPREERAWEEFHPHLDIEATFMIFSANEVDGIVQELPRTPVVHTPGTPLNGLRSPSRQIHPASAGTTPNASHQHETNPFDAAVSTPTRWPRRMTRDVSSSYGVRQADALGTPKTPKILPIQNQTPKERLDLKLPSYRRTTHREEFEREPTGQVRHVDQVMSQVGYQQNDSFLRPGRELLKAIDGTPDDDLSSSPPALAGESGHIRRLGRVEYDMDEQDDTWLEQYNSLRQEDKIDAISREMFEITMTKIEKAWHALEKRIPKPNPKPPQTHRPRSSSAAAVNGEPHAGEEPDSKCVICDDGDCENTNAIVFCDGCNLAVHQECYGVPFIPEGQWLCRKCQLCGRGVPVSLVITLANITHADPGPRLASSVRTPMVLSNRQILPNGLIYFVRCGFLRFLLEITHLWSPSWMLRKFRKPDGDYLVISVTKKWVPAYNAATRTVIRPSTLPVPEGPSFISR